MPSEWELRMQSMLYLVLNDLRSQERGEEGRFSFDGSATELRRVINEMEFAVTPPGFAIEGGSKQRDKCERA